MKHTIGSIIGFVIIVVIIIVGFYVYRAHPTATEDQNIGVTFPAGGETLTQGQTYTLTWNDPENTATTTQIFLIDTALQAQGQSVSIADRVYDVPNTGSYQYTIPATLPDSTYEFEIGTQTSNTFEILSMTE